MPHWYVFDTRLGSMVIRGAAWAHNPADALAHLTRRDQLWRHVQPVPIAVWDDNYSGVATDDGTIMWHGRGSGNAVASSPTLSAPLQPSAPAAHPAPAPPPALPSPVASPVAPDATPPPTIAAPVQVAARPADPPATPEVPARTIMFGGVLYDMPSPDRLALTLSLANSAMIHGVQAGDLRWLEPGTDFTWRARDGSLTPMDAPTFIAFALAALPSI